MGEPAILCRGELWQKRFRRVAGKVSDIKVDPLRLAEVIRPRVRVDHFGVLIVCVLLLICP